jgi:hypothetical protein
MDYWIGGLASELHWGFRAKEAKEGVRCSFCECGVCGLQRNVKRGGCESQKYAFIGELRGFLEREGGIGCNETSIFNAISLQRLQRKVDRK